MKEYLINLGALSMTIVFVWLIKWVNTLLFIDQTPSVARNETAIIIIIVLFMVYVFTCCRVLITETLSKFKEIDECNN